VHQAQAPPRGLTRFPPPRPISFLERSTELQARKRRLLWRPRPQMSLQLDCRHLQRRELSVVVSSTKATIVVGHPKRSHGPQVALRTLSRLILIPVLPSFWCLTPSPASKYLNARSVYVFNKASGLLLSWLKKVWFRMKFMPVIPTKSVLIRYLLCVFILYTCRCH
jgi:hypothetical protein